MLRATFERTSPELVQTGDTATWLLEVTNTGLQTEVVTSELVQPYMVVKRAETVVEAAPAYTNGASGVGLDHTLPPSGKVSITATYGVPAADGIRVTPVMILTWPETPPVVNGVTLDFNRLELEPGSALINYRDWTEHLEARNEPGRIADWIESHRDGTSTNSMVDALASGVDFETWIRDTAAFGGSGVTPGQLAAAITAIVHPPNPGPLEQVVLPNANGSTTHIAWRRRIDEAVAGAYTWHDRYGVPIATPANDGLYVPGNLKVARADADAPGVWATTFMGTWNFTEPTLEDVVVFDADQNEDKYSIQKAPGGAWQPHQTS